MYALDFLATISNCDAEGRLKLCSALQMMQDCSEMWIDSEPVLKRFFDERGSTQLLVSRQVEIVRVPACKERLTVATSVFGMRPKFGYRNTFVLDAAGKPCYRTWSTGAFVKRATGALDPVDDATIASVAIEDRREMAYRDRRIAVPAGAGTECAPVRIQRSDIDYNGHVNNANYVRIAQDLLPDDFRVRALRVEYRVPAKFGDELVPTIHTAGTERVVVLSLAGRTSAIVEFSGE